ncbi:MAG: HDOD domain-containing protein [Deltaproteobacteria bacterium]|nr:HDOD domain-containing protein [Deltaproteobacteria bacterium]
MSESGLTEKKCGTCGCHYKTETDYQTMGYRHRLCNAGHLWFECRCGSTLMLKQGNHPWYNPLTAMSAEAAALYQGKKELLDHFPILPSALMRLQETIRNPEKSSDDISKVLQKVPVLSAEILRQANHLRTGGSGIHSVSHAISYLGRPAISDLAFTASLRMYQFRTVSYNQKKFWKEAFLTGLLAQQLGKKYTPDVTGDLMYLSGSLCNIGKFVGALCLPEETDQIDQSMSNPKTMTTWSQAEIRNKTCSHVTLGDIAGALWGLPGEIRSGIMDHHKPVKKPQAEKAELTVGECVGLATQLCHWINSEPHRINTGQLKSFQTYLGLNEQKTEDLVSSMAHLSSSAEIQASDLN